MLIFSIQKFLHFFGADKEAVLNMTNFRCILIQTPQRDDPEFFRRVDHRDNLLSTLGYEVSGDYPRFTYRQNEIVWYLDQLEEVTFVRYVSPSMSWNLSAVAVQDP